MTLSQKRILYDRLNSVAMKTGNSYTINVVDRFEDIPNIDDPDYKIELIPVMGIMSGVDQVVDITRSLKGHISIFVSQTNNGCLILV